MELQYATTVYGGLCQRGLLPHRHQDGSSCLVVPEGASVPSDVPEGMTIVQQPLDNIYLAATSTMDFFRAVDGIGNVTLSSLKADDWYIPEAKNAMENGTMTYAGKYRAPDYELILSKGCDLALENTMIYHTPEVKEELEASSGIPVLVGRSSYEGHPCRANGW
ncbi:MAG: hypothetical protein ACLUNZ_02585 [Evtepia sp.]